MLKGDLSATPLSDVLSSLADQSATGCLHIDDESGDEALVYFKNGRVYAAYVPGRRPQLGARLISSGALAPEALAEALDAQETELQGWRLGELLVHLGYVERPVVEAFVLEQLREAAFDLSRWPSGRFRFRKNEKTREDVGSHAAVPDLLEEVARRRVEWDVMSGVVHGPAAVPVLSAGGLASAEMALDQDQWALLCKVDGERTIAQLARDCGFTSYEAGQIVYALVGAGLLQVEETFEEPEAEPEPPAIDEQLAPLGAALASAFATEAGEEPYGGSEISRLLGAQADAPAAESTGGDLKDELASLTAALADLPSLAPPADLAPEEPFPASDDPFGDSLARVSHALSALLGESLPAVSLPLPPPKHEPTAAELASARAEAERMDRIRAAAAAELAQAHAMAEAERQAAEEAVRLEAERAVAEEEAWAEYAQRAVAEQLTRLDAERHAAEAARLDAERRAADEAARLEGERRAAEEAARLEAERLDAERRAADEAARLEAERLDAERRAAEEAARLEAERLDAERRAAEEAARLEAERLAAEAAAQLEAERLEAERLAADEAAQLEAERLEAERLAADEAARVEAERLLADEAARLEAERLAAEAATQLEAERFEAERLETERLAAEEAARLEAERLAAEEAARIEAEARVRAERYAAEEAARADAEEAARAAEQAAHAAAVELIPDPAPAPVVPPADAPAAFDVASLLRDINAAPTAPADTVETVEEYFLETPPAPPEHPATNGNSRPLSDTAALLRELTSLGLDDEPNPAAAAGAAVNRPHAQPKEQPKKRKGLFGRS